MAKTPDDLGGEEIVFGDGGHVRSDTEEEEMIEEGEEEEEVNKERLRSEEENAVTEEDPMVKKHLKLLS